MNGWTYAELAFHLADSCRIPIFCSSVNWLVFIRPPRLGADQDSQPTSWPRLRGGRQTTRRAHACMEGSAAVASPLQSLELPQAAADRGRRRGAGARRISLGRDAGCAGRDAERAAGGVTLVVVVRRVVSRLDVRALSTALCGLRWQQHRRIPEPGMSQLPTNPILAALPEHSGNRRISAGSTVDAASHPRRITITSTLSMRSP